MNSLLNKYEVTPVLPGKLRSEPETETHIIPKRQDTGQQDLGHSEVITILSWNPRFTVRDWWYKDEEFKACDSSSKRRCVYTMDRTLYNRTDVILLDTFFIGPSHLPAYRFPRQKWLFLGYESPGREQWPKYGRYDGWFNVSMTYATQADVFEPYGICFDSLATPSQQNAQVRRVYGESDPYVDVVERSVSAYRKRASITAELILSKNKNIMWIVSHCETDSKREMYVAELSKHIDVDVFGGCGDKQLSMADEAKFLDHDYRFYLSFENSLCDQYITEKLYKILNKDAIPIVLGNTDYEAILPPKSFIDVRDFRSARLLAEYLKTLAKNDDLYGEYFAWKRRHACYVSLPIPTQACRLCNMLNRKYGVTQRISSVEELWSKKKACLTSDKFYERILYD